MFDFEENTAVKDLATIPEQFRPLYEEDKTAGVFKIKAGDPVIKGAVEGILGVSKALKAERAVTKDLKSRVVDLAPLGDYGKTPEEIATAVQAKIDELQGKKFDLVKVKADIAAGYATEIQKRDAKVKALNGQLEALLVDNAIRSAATGKVVDPDLIMPFAKERVRVVDEDGKLQVRVVDEHGNQRFSPATANPFTIPELIEEMGKNQKYATIFQSQSKSGAGTKPGAAATRIVDTGGILSATEKIARGLAKRGM